MGSYCSKLLRVSLPLKSLSIVRQQLIPEHKGVASESKIYLVMGAIVKNDPTVKKYNVSQIVPHPDYVKDVYQHDIALIRTKKVVIYTDFIRPICLPVSNMNLKRHPFRYCVMSGMGLIAELGHATNFLMQGRMNVIPKDQCIQSLAKIGINVTERIEKFLKNDDLFCAGSEPTTTGVSFCDGDAGSPLVCKNTDGIWTQIGVASYSYKTNRSLAHECSNNIFTKLDIYLKFINNRIQS